MYCVQQGNTTDNSNKPQLQDVSFDTDTGDLLKKMKYCRSMKVIENAGFSYNTETEIVSCSVCVGKSGSGEFFYSADEGLEFD